MAKKTPTKTPSKIEKNISVDSKDIQKSYENWNTYNKENIDLMSSFTAIDDSGKKVGKELFLNLLRTGLYIPIKTDKPYNYQLVEINADADSKIKKTIRSAAKIAVKYHNMEGKKLPEYDFVDINGVSYNKKDTEGKLLVLKCWFITCKICVEEFPELNALVDRYKDENVEFVSLAFDKGDKLTEFLKTKPFKYSVIPEQKDYMNKKLKVKQYPTHVIVDTDGTILKMTNNVRSLTHELDKITGKNNS
ncbi:hypothetical protein WH52_11750 [Tenacibaculum holothuriorum]|uniref:Thioredoxin domain-containing protein n=1 Tax=Tenacibaculum holothuriorum TaxID=1635173 RepID=A0A1Y2PBK4_9FLAO|nr:hypothetical protein WH52_11750 [Tenacibaculum holothuriorum]